MNCRTDRQIVRSPSQPDARRRRRTAAAAIAAVTAAVVLAGCGSRIAGAQAEQAAVPAAPQLAVTANSGCVQATPVFARALSVLNQLRHGAVTAAGARRLLAAGQAETRKLARTTSDDVLQENLAEASDAFAAFRSVMMHRNAPAYQRTFTDLAGKLTGFRRICSVGNSDFGDGTRGWAATGSNTALTRSATAHDARWSLRVTNAGTALATAGLTDSPPWVASTLKGPERIGLWARALTGTPAVTLRVVELSGGTVVGSNQVTMRLDSTFRFEGLTYQVRRPGASSLSVTVSAAGMAPGHAFLVDDITIVRG